MPAVVEGDLLPLLKKRALWGVLLDSRLQPRDADDYDDDTRRSLFGREGKELRDAQGTSATWSLPGGWAWRVTVDQGVHHTVIAPDGKETFVGRDDAHPIGPILRYEDLDTISAAAGDPRLELLLAAMTCSQRAGGWPKRFEKALGSVCKLPAAKARTVAELLVLEGRPGKPPKAGAATLAKLLSTIADPKAARPVPAATTSHAATKRIVEGDLLDGLDASAWRSLLAGKPLAKLRGKSATWTLRGGWRWRVQAGKNVESVVVRPDGSEIMLGGGKPLLRFPEMNALVAAAGKDEHLLLLLSRVSASGNQADFMAAGRAVWKALTSVGVNDDVDALELAQPNFDWVEDRKRGWISEDAKSPRNPKTPAGKAFQKAGGCDVLRELFAALGVTR